MGETVHELLRRAHIAVGRDDELRRGAERNERFARRDRAQAHCADGRVAAACRQENAARQAELVGGLGPDPARRRRALEEPRRPGGIGLAGQERFRRPGPRRLVEEPGPGRVAHVGAPFAAERKAQIVLRRQDRGDAAAMVRLMPGDPFELRPGETGHRLHADDSGEIGIIAGQLIGLAMGACVVVQDRRADRLVGAVDEDRAVHLAGEADRLQRAERLAGRFFDVGDRSRHRGQPVVGILLRPAGARTGGRIAARGARDRLAALVRQQRLKAGGSAVEPEIHGLELCAARGALTRAERPSSTTGL